MPEKTDNVYSKPDRFKDNFVIALFIVGSIAFISFFYFLDRIVITIPAGHGGVLYLRFFGGTVTDKVYGEGIQIIFPWDTMTIYDTRLHEVQQEVQVLSQSGLLITLTVSIRFRPVYGKLGILHKTVGSDYLEKVIKPVTIASVREVVGKFRPEELYTSKREVIQDEMLIEAIEKNGPHPIQFEDIIIRTLFLPPLINAAIEGKLKQEQTFLEYEFRLQREAQEAKRKLIEAQGRERFQSVVSQSLNQNYLQWRGIQATLKLAESPNTKVIVIGGGKDGLPIILNTETYKPQEEMTLSLPGKAVSEDQEKQTKEKSTPISQETLDESKDTSTESSEKVSEELPEGNTTIVESSQK